MSKLKVHTTEQPNSDITAFILSCNRLHLLKRTVETFMATKEIKVKTVIVDDSGEEGVFEYLVKEYGDFSDIVCFPVNRGLFWAKDFMTSFCHTEYIFYIEEDWEFLKPGYLQKSKEILQKYREIGSIDISWRTFEEYGLKTYDENALEDGTFYYKTPLKISKDHLHWLLWMGSPNLKRREDLILLGRVEKYFNEWNVDRKFHSLGLKGIYLNDRYVTHIGDGQSLMVNKRTNEGATPETLFPEELKKNRSFPEFDYYEIDHIINQEGLSYTKNYERVFITLLLDINREGTDGRNFNSHYIQGLENISNIPQPLVVFCEESLVSKVYSLRGNKPTSVVTIDISTMRQAFGQYSKIKEIVQDDTWRNQAEWMNGSIIQDPDYIQLTLFKLEALKICIQAELFNSEKYYWIDSGISNSFGLGSITNYDLSKIPSDKVFITSFPYNVITEIHGYSKQGFMELLGTAPDKVLRASLFGGPTTHILPLIDEFENILRESVKNGFIGTEEALLTLVYYRRPDLFNLYTMVNGNIGNYLLTLCTLMKE